MFLCQANKGCGVQRVWQLTKGGIDRTEIIVLNSPVKIIGIFILIVFIVTVFSLLKPSFLESHSSKCASFFTLDVCHKATASVLSAFDVSTLCEKKCELLKPVFTSPHTVTNPTFYFYQCVSLMDHPPDA